MLTVGELFAGIGGFSAGFEKVGGYRTLWQVENNSLCLQVLHRHWPEAQRFGDIREFHAQLPAVDIVAGGDPCPHHSRARSNGDSNSPDLAGYFLAVVGRLRPQWVVRENVPAPTVRHFVAALDALGYGTVVVRIDAAAITGQSRQRDFVIGCHQSSRCDLYQLFQDCQDGTGAYTTRLGAGQVAPALTTHRTRYDSRDCYVWEPERGLRILDGDERCRLAGFAKGWASGFSEAAQAKFFGNAVVPQAVEYLARKILLHRGSR